MDESQNAVPDPVAWPQITFAGKTYEVKFLQGNLIRLRKELGVDIEALKAKEMKSIEAAEHIYSLLAAGISHAVKITADKLADEPELQDVPALGKLVNVALSKVSAQVAAREAAKQQVQQISSNPGLSV